MTKSIPTFKTCPVCHGQFRVKPSHFDLKTYCSRACMIEGDHPMSETTEPTARERL